ncbi:MAG: M50 family metallopeptidase [Prosthecobacter sp.]
MLRFSLFGFPVLIHWMFWLNAAIMGGAIGASTPADMRRLIGWIIAVFVSILIHELGHALTMRNYGDRRVGIVMYAFGGLAQGSRRLTRNEDILVTAAGPALQLLVGLTVGWSVTLWRPSSMWLWETLDAFTVVSIFWALLNLVPVIPLDGGRLCAAFLGQGKTRQVLTISLVCSGIMALMSFQNRVWLRLQDTVMDVLDIDAGTRVGGGIFMLLLFGMLAWNNWKQLRNEPQIPWMNAR